MENKQSNLATRKLTVVDLLMINIVAITSLRNIPITAKYGFSIIYLYIIIALMFFVPCAIAVAELSTKFPKAGGVVTWVNKAFGDFASMMLVWMQWIYNTIFFPTLTVFAATQIVYFFTYFFPSLDPRELSSNAVYLVLSSFVVFWSAMLLNLLGIKFSGKLSKVATIFGVIFPVMLLILLSCISNFFHLTAFSNVQDVDVSSSLFSEGFDFSLMIIMFFSFIGLEVSSAHANKVDNPVKNFPRAIYLGVIIIPVLLILSNISVSTMIPAHLIDSRAGLIETFNVIFAGFNMLYMQPIMSFALFFGCFGCLSAWMIAISRYLEKIASMNFLPKILSKTTKNDVPIAALIFQGIIFSILCLSYNCTSYVQTAYWFLCDLAAQIALIANIVFLTSAIKLRLTYSFDDAHTFTRWKSVSIAFYVLGILGCILGICLGFLTPGHGSMSLIHFNLLLLTGIVFVIVIPFLSRSLMKKGNN